MFDMQNIGRTIATARKAHDMTQMELADRLNISFQAISNWERGISMPDISKLPEIAELLGLTIDELLGKSSPVIHNLLSEEQNESVPQVEIEAEDVIEAAPILKPSQLEDVVEKNKGNFNTSQLASFLPFLPRDFVNELAERAYEEDGSKGLHPFLPFLGKSKIDALAVYENKNGRSIAALLPFMSRPKLTELAMQKYKADGLSSITAFLPFINKELRQEIAEAEYAQHGLSSLNPLLPFLDKNWLMDVIKKQMNL